ncbi:hypothetical protein BU26DRAFT_439913 [Trematosphaeria pertusa]|uniref:Uncharacterized protein n=1 Tax=Trematosphaeria pertusa TaxID=390896 RepID=A0A6A6HUZ8_9PLEO|nr:uncharacterized protein BU26DRAFT_439913 [Trematosphaeria pertusa]KAF2241847.1 hypothetical protein BU26DRAFT_439913 [Trematosphaeria pertusa]
MPGAKPVLPPLPPAATQEAVSTTPYAHDKTEVKTALLGISSDLLGMQDCTPLFGTSSPDPYAPSLQTLHFRLENGYLAPSPLQAHTSEEARIKATVHIRTPKKPLARPLEDFEDLYYAMLGAIKHMHQILDMRLGSGFNALHDSLFEGGITIQESHAWLAEQWDILNRPELVKALDDAIRRSRVKHLHQELLAQLHAGDLTQADADELLADLYDPEEYDGVQGCAWIGRWSAAMIAGWLEEKYRIVLKVEKQEAGKKERWERKMARIERANKEKAAKKEQEMQEERERQQFETAEQQQSGMFDGAGDIQTERMKQGQEQEQGQSDVEWHMKTQRVSQYSQYLRGLASYDARQLMSSINTNLQQSLYNGSSGPIQEEGDGDVHMSDA